MPERKHVDLLTAYPVVQMIVNARQVDAPHASRLSVQCRGTNSRLRSQKRKSFRQFFVQCAGRKRTILLPPIGGLLDMRFGALGDLNPHSLFSCDGG